ncbi:serine/threonine-protein kinase [Niveomyces insectorum RCEF 264]|uniref:non-specific serine/threonine protein kinase n=1 Tax=Niveomyces insectorum RCEF 264 TaxID=1081102 RepID=A0A167QY30_9HYPO|nr:serine/threonine-protein kinase [Niveomyces insectorum RCEF 264]
MASSSSRRQRTGEDAAIGQFLIGGEIGKGSFAQVYIGKQKVSGAAVAVKSVELARLNKKLKENLYGEIKILKTLRHPHIVALHDCVESATHINLIMEYCELGDLSMFIKKREKLITNPATHDMARKYPSAPSSGLNEVITRHFLKQLASALKFLREGNFVHRDVKPQNLLLLPSPAYRDAHKSSRPILTASHDSLIPAAGLFSLPMLKLADFGFARVLPSTTLAETLCGSPLYMAPEILRYERYDAKADLWSVGTVLYEMVCGRPPFRASNHVELLRKIEAAEDLIRFPRDCIVSAEMKALIRALLKRNPVERLSFDNFFNHNVVVGPIPGLVEDDVPRSERHPQPLERVPEHRRSSKDLRPALATSSSPSSSPKPSEPVPSSTPPAPPAAGGAPTSRRQSFRRYIPENAPSGAGAADLDREAALAAAAAGAVASSSPQDAQSRGDISGPRQSYSPRQQHPDLVEGLGIRRPPAQSSNTAPASSRPVAYEDRKLQPRPSNTSPKQYQVQGQSPQPPQQLHHRYTAREGSSPASSLRNELIFDDDDPADTKTGQRAHILSEEQERAAQDIAFERDYVLVEKKHVEVNAFADEMAANPRLAAQYQQASTSAPNAEQAMVRRSTQQGHPTSATGAVAPTPSRAMQVAQGALTRPFHGGERPSSLSASPNSTTSFIAKAIHDASFRLLGVKSPVTLMGKGTSPPQLYSPFPAYPTPSAAAAAAALITDGRHGSGESGSGSAATDGDARVAQLIEDYATRSDVVYGFAEVKYKQLVPLAPSAEHDLSGLPVAEKADAVDSDDELTLDAVVVLSEEALVLYVKALSLLAKSMDIASMWWRSKMRGSGAMGNGGSASYLLLVRESPLGQRINAAVQWIRSRFNEVLEKATFARERLVEAQRRLPEDHPSHPSNHNRDDSAGLGNVGATTPTAAGSSTDGVYLSAGVSAEKLMYDRAVEMSRAAAIGEISNGDLAGCELSYMTAICMLEAVLDTEDDATRRRLSTSSKDEKAALDDNASDINMEDQRTVESMIAMIKTRLAVVRRKAHAISNHSRAAQQQQSLVRRRSGDVTPRSVPSHAS